MTAKWQVLIIDNSAIGIAGLCVFLQKLELVGNITVEANLKSALTLCEKNDYDLILFDLCMYEYSGFEFLERLMTHKPKSHVLTFSDCPNFVYALKALKIGAKGYFSKDISKEDFIKAVEQVATGNNYIESALAQKIAIQMINDEPHPCEKLTTREFEVFRLLSKGYNSHQISDRLYLSYKTTCNYVSKIKEKLDVHNNVQLINLAHEYGLISHEQSLTEN
jgi:DNA-binding NarL/FixJ family response regulator